MTQSQGVYTEWIIKKAAWQCSALFYNTALIPSDHSLTNDSYGMFRH